MSDRPDGELAAQVERLERVARDLREDGLTQEAVRELADEALITAERISQLLPRALEGDGT